MAIEWNTQHTHTEQIRQVHTQAVALYGGFPNAPKDYSHQKHHIYDKTGIEGKAEGVDKQQFEPSAHFYDTGHDSVQHGSHQCKTAGQGHQRATGICLGITAEIIYQHKRGQAKQVKQVDTDAETRQIGNENKPAV